MATSLYTIALKELKTVRAFFGRFIILWPYELSFCKQSFNITLLHAKCVKIIRKTDTYLRGIGVPVTGNLPQNA